MSRLVPHPLLSLALLAMWLLLTQVSLGHAILGTAVALVAGRAMAAVQPEKPQLKRWGQILRLAAIVTADIVRSNIAVASVILAGGRHGARRSSFIRMQLQLRDPSALALLAIIITATPGTAWMEHDTDSGQLLIHVFDVIDEEEWRKLIHERYEMLLMEIFE